MMKGKIKSLFGLVFVLTTLSLLFISLSASSALAASTASGSCPSSPKTYVGNVYVNGNMLVRDYEIRAMIGSKDVGIGTVTNGHYSVSVSPACLSGDIYFYVNGVKANEKASYIYGTTNFDTVQLDLTLNQEPPLAATCGNGIVNPGEECDGTNFNGVKCTNRGLFCNSDCTIDYSNCQSGSQLNPIAVENSSNSSVNSNATNTTAGSTNVSETGNNSQASTGSSGITGGAIGASSGNYTIYYIIGGVILLVIIIAIARSSSKKKKEKTESGGVSFEIRE